MPRFLVELDARPTPREAVSDEAITDIIEAVLDDLDARRVDPSVGTTRSGDSVDLTGAVVVEADDGVVAVGLAVEHVGDALRRQPGLSAAVSSVSVRSSALTPTGRRCSADVG